MFSGREKTFAAIILLFAASAVSASPTVISGSPLHIISPSADNSANDVACVFGTDSVREQISEFGKALLQPPSTDGRTTAGNNHYLPAVPPAIAMVLIGFLCISLIRDRKTWLTVLVGLFAIGQAGINALPELSRLGRRVHASRLIEPTLLAAYPLVGGYYPESYNEQTRYTGLLHHLEGIPRRTNAFTNNCATLNRHFSGVAGKDTRVLHYAIIKAQLVFSKTSDCLVSGTRQFVCFTPAFIFNLIPRGPPISPWKTLL